MLRSVRFTQKWNLFGRFNLNWVAKVVIESILFDLMSIVIWIESKRHHEVVRSLADLNLLYQLDWEGSLLQWLQISQFDGHTGLFGVSFGVDGRFTTSNCILVLLLCFLFVLNYSFDSFIVNLSFKFRKDRAFFEGKFIGTFQRVCIAWVLVLKRDIKHSDWSGQGAFNVDFPHG